MFTDGDSQTPGCEGGGRHDVERIDDAQSSTRATERPNERANERANAKTDANARPSLFTAAPVVPASLASSFLETARDALDAMRFDAPRRELAAYYAGGFAPRATVTTDTTTTASSASSNGITRRRTEASRSARAGLFGAYLRFFGFPSAFEARRALARFGLGPPGSGLDPEAVAVALAVGLPGIEPAAALRVARCGL